LFFILVWNHQMYVSDLGNYRILAFPLTTTQGSPDGVTVVGRYGAGPALNQINSVYYMSIDTVRQLFYLSDFQNNRILKLNLTDNSLQLFVGTGIAGSNNVSLNLSLGMTVDETTGSLYVADSRNHRVQKFNFNSIQGVTVAGGMNYGQSLSQLYLPSGVAIDPAGNVYVADSGNHRIVQWLVGAPQGRIIAGKADINA
jgi:sugar lactone lactonase YvrE